MDGKKYNCTNCNTKIWDTHLKCPECGANTKRGKYVMWSKILLIPFIILVIAIVVMIGERL